MKVTIYSDLILGDKKYAKGTQELPDNMYFNESFKRAVKAGMVVLHPRDSASELAQASKDERASRIAQELKKSAGVSVAARLSLANVKVVV